MQTEDLPGRSESPLALSPGSVRALPGPWARRGLDALVVMHVVALGALTFLLAFGQEGARVAPVAGAAMVALFLLACFYARWLFPSLGWRFILAVVLLKELGVLAFFGLVLGVSLVVRWLT